MLIEFRVENFRSLRDEQKLTFEAAPDLSLDDQRLRRLAIYPTPLLPAAVIYGSNASGKSNLLLALAFMREAVVHSLDHWKSSGGIPRKAFAWASKRREPSLFEAMFLLDDWRFQYGFTVDDRVVAEEWLFAWTPMGRQVWLEREHQHFTFGPQLDADTREAVELTRDNSLLLSAAGRCKHPQLAAVANWFERICLVNLAHRLPWSGLVQQARSPYEWLEQMNTVRAGGDTLKRRSLDLLRSADLGIVDIKQVAGPANQPRVLLKHTAAEDSWLDWEDESEGTQCLIRMAPLIVQTIETGGLLLIDELESNLHPLIGAAIVKLFNSPRSNARHAQVLFTTHDTRLLGTAMGDTLLRRDQVWFAEKDPDGASKIYPLTDFQPKQHENLESGYLQGRYGAVPYCPDIGWNEE